MYPRSVSITPLLLQAHATFTQRAPRATTLPWLRLLVKPATMFYVLQASLPAMANPMLPMRAFTHTTALHHELVLAAPTPIVLLAPSNAPRHKTSSPKNDTMFASSYSRQQKTPQAVIRIGVTLQSILTNFQGTMISSVAE